MKSETHLLTGGTGFLGSVLVLEILARSPGDALWCLVRPGPDGDTRERVISSITAACRLFGRPDLENSISDRVHLAIGDVRELPRGVNRELSSEIDSVWHVAASLDFSSRRQEQTFQTNVEGTRAVLSLADDIGAEKFNYVSTAYVAGSAVGEISEVPAENFDIANNPYEESKMRAEQLVRRSGLDWQIIRPTILIGHSDTYATTSRSGLYAAIDRALIFKRHIAKRIYERLEGRPLRVWGDGTAKVNLLPVDIAARNAVAIHSSDRRQTIWHVANSTPPSLEEVAKSIQSLFGMPLPEYVTSEEGMTPLERKLARESLFRRYLESPKIFSTKNLDDLRGVDASRVDLSGKALARYVEWYLREVHGDRR